ncbi:uncharacterized protein LOC143352206 [Halictus rubicundus]|uniref:uncharacterized protein LOC143352206 n=1 Tax=Halictus rubicundus TaxID=77578 RepID=UPI004036A23A
MASPNTVSKSVKFGLHFAGVWPGTPFPGVHKVFWIFFMVLLQTYQYEYIIRRYKTESLMILIDSLSISMPFTLVCIKLIVSWMNQGLLREILSTMKEDCEKYAAIDTNNFIPKTSMLSFRLTSMITSSYLVSAVFYIVGTLEYQQRSNSTTRELLFKMDLPFDTNESPVYELVVTAQFLHLATSAITYGTFTCLLLMVTLHVGCHVDILCSRMTESSVTDKEQVRFFISRQQEITMFVEKIEQLFTYIALSQLISNTFITCCVGYLIVISLSAENALPMLMKCILFYYVICLEAFIYCFVGEFLDIKSKMIAKTAYDMPWYNLHPNVSRQLVLLILRAQKGLPLTFGKFSMMNLESFTSIMKASASYISVLLAITVSQPVKYGLHFVGIWPGTPFPGLRKFFWVLSTTLCQIYQYKYVITHFTADGLMDMVNCLCFALPYTMTMVKLVIVWTNHGRLEVALITISRSVLCEILSTMEEDCAKYAVVDANNAISKTANLSHRLTSTLGFFFLTAVSCHSATILAIPRSNNSTDELLVISMDLPFDINGSPTYEIVIAAQVIHLTATAYTFGLFSTLLLMMILHVGCVIDILCDVLAHVSAEETGQLRFVAVGHQQVILFTEKIEQLFTYISFCQLLSNTLVTCCLGFLAITALETGNGLPLLFKFFSAYAAICLEIFIYCFAGEYLNIKSQMIVDAAYQVSWYELRPNISRQLALLILKSQRGLPLTFGKFSNLSLDSFTSIMKASASYMSILLAIS